MHIFENNAHFFLLIILSFYCVRNYQVSLVFCRYLSDIKIKNWNSGSFFFSFSYFFGLGGNLSILPIKSSCS